VSMEMRIDGLMEKQVVKLVEKLGIRFKESQEDEVGMLEDTKRVGLRRKVGDVAFTIS
jgi:hypothetical protein